MLRGASAYVRQNAVAFLALFVALGGTGVYAADTIRSEDIVDGEVKNVDLSARAVTGGKVVDGTIRGVDIGDGSIRTDDLGPLQRLSFGDFQRLELDAKSRLSSRGFMAAPGIVLRGFSPEKNVFLHEYELDGRPALGLGREVPTGYATSTLLAGIGPEHVVGAAGEPPFAASEGCTAWHSFTQADRVHFRLAGPRAELGGVAAGGTVGCPIFRLPEDFQPCTRQVRATLSNGKLGRITVEVDGAVKADPPTTDGWVALSGISFVSDGAGVC